MAIGPFAQVPRLGYCSSALTLFVKTNPRKFARAGREGLRFPLGRALRSPGTESMIIERGENLLLLSAKGDMMISRIKSRRSIPTRWIFGGDDTISHHYWSCGEIAAQSWSVV